MKLSHTTKRHLFECSECHMEVDAADPELQFKIVTRDEMTGTSCQVWGIECHSCKMSFAIRVVEDLLFAKDGKRRTFCLISGCRLQPVVMASMGIVL